MLKRYRDIQFWKLPEGPSVNFDDIFRSIYDTSRIPELYDRLIGLLTKIMESDAVDRRKILDDLEKLIAMLTANRNGSYFSSYSTFQTVAAGCRNVIYHLAADTPVLGALVKGVQDTMKETGLEWRHVHDDMRKSIATAASFKVINIEQSHSGLLPGPTNDEIDDPPADAGG